MAQVACLCGGCGTGLSLTSSCRGENLVVARPVGVSIEFAHQSEPLRPGKRFEGASYACVHGGVSGSRLTNPATDGISPPTLPAERALPKLWISGKPFSAQYYYDEPLNDVLLPDNLDLSDAWAVQVVKANVRTEDRKKK
ncbi:hypothetical protein BDR22DRAFT_818034 [Usnea florida]